MKTKTKNDVQVIVDSIVDDYANAKPDEKTKVLGDLIKGINVIKDLESDKLDNSIKRKKIKLEEDKLAIEHDKLDLDVEKLKTELKKIAIDEKKIALEEVKFKESTKNETLKLELESTKLDFEKQKFNLELRRAKADKLFNGVMKGLEIGIPLIVYGGLSVLSLKAIYKDDVRVPSETWGFIRSVSKK